MEISLLAFNIHDDFFWKAGQNPFNTPLVSHTSRGVKLKKMKGGLKDGNRTTRRIPK